MRLPPISLLFMQTLASFILVGFWEDFLRDFSCVTEKLIYNLQLQLQLTFTGQTKMAFVNEYVSDEDVKEYGLEEIKYRFSPEWRIPGLPDGYKFRWTVDRERNIYLMRVGVGRDDISNRSYWVLNYQGIEVEIQVERGDNGSLTFSDNPYRIIWDLVRIKPDHIPGVVDRDELILILKEGLTAFGDDGISHQVENTIVEFNF